MDNEDYDDDRAKDMTSKINVVQNEIRKGDRPHYKLHSHVGEL